MHKYEQDYVIYNNYLDLENQSNLKSNLKSYVLTSAIHNYKNPLLERGCIYICLTYYS